MAYRVRVYGRSAPWDELAQAIDQYVSGAVVSWGTYDEHVLSEHVYRNDVLICFVDEANDEAALNFVLQFVRHHGTYTYATVVVVGADKSPKEKEFLRLGAAWYVHAGQSAKHIVGRALKTFRKTWWHGVWQQKFPTFVVDDKGRVVRANRSAEERFGPSLLGGGFTSALEKCGNFDLPDPDPISASIRSAQVVMQDLAIRAPDGARQRFVLICTPLNTIGQSPRSAMVLMVDVSRSEAIIKASTVFGQTSSLADLCLKIVAQAQRLGFPRVRLYEYLADNGRKGLLKMRADVGYGPKKARKLEREFCIDLEEDEPSRDTKSRTVPRLYQRSKTHRPDTEFVRYFVGDPNFADELVKKGLRQWIEVPIWLPPTERSGARFWGKMSIDHGAKKQEFDSFDLTELGLFSVVVGNAIAAAERAEEEKKSLSLVRSSSEQVVAAATWDDNSFLNVVGIALDLYLKLTGADIVLYRQNDPDSPGPPFRVGEPKFREPELADRYSVPLHVVADPAGKLFPLLDPDRKDHRPYIVPNPKPAYEKLLERWADELPVGEALPEREVAYLRAIRSEMQVPVFDNETVNGVFVAVSLQEHAFSEETVARVERVMYNVSTWIELARQHSSRLWMENVLGKTNSILPLLADLPLDDDELFFAGLAALLSANAGLLWNRVLVFSCVPPCIRDCAELVYAVGGSVDHQDDHRKLQAAFAQDPCYNDLNALVKERIARPQPDYRSADGQAAFHDGLYEAFVLNPRKDESPIRIAAGTAFGAESIAPEDLDPGDTDPKHPLAWFRSELERQDWSGPRLKPLVLNHPTRSLWVQDMRAKYKGMFHATKPVYVFPLWCPYNEVSKLLGIVVVDMHHPAKPPRDTMVAATQVVLGLAGDIFGARVMSRRLQGWHNVLPALLHGRSIKEVWDDIRAAADATGREKYEREMDERMQRLYESAKFPVVKNLGAFLRTAPYSEEPLQYEFDLQPNLDGYVLECDPLALRDAMRFLISNSVNAATQARMPLCDLRIHVAAGIRESPCPNFDVIVYITVSDNGPGISPDIGTLADMCFSTASQRPKRPSIEVAG